MKPETRTWYKTERGYVLISDLMEDVHKRLKTDPSKIRPEEYAIGDGCNLDEPMGGCFGRSIIMPFDKNGNCLTDKGHTLQRKADVVNEIKWIHGFSIREA